MHSRCFAERNRFNYGESRRLEFLRRREARWFRQSSFPLATLLVLQGPDKGRTINCTDRQFLIGRGSSQVPLTDQTVSRQHAELRAVENGWILADLGSANGTYLNGVRIAKPSKIKAGDQIRVGSTLLVYTGDPTISQFSGPNIPHDLVTLDAGSLDDDSSVQASVPASSEDSIVIAAPETAQAVKAWNALQQITTAVSSLLPVEQLLTRVLDIIFEEVPVDRGVIFQRDEQTGDYLPTLVRYHTLRGESTKETPPIVTSRTILNHVIRLREGVLSANVIGDTRFASGKSVQNLGMRSVICVPILARDQLHGLIHLDCAVTRHMHTEAELRLIIAIGNQTGLALENSRLVQQHMQRERLAAAGETVAYLSHYIKNILQGMRSGAEIVERGLERRDFAVIGNGWKMVERNLDRSYDLMLNMLAYSKDREPRIEMLTVNAVVREVVELVQKRADDANVVLLSELDAAVPPIPADYDGVHQVALNLLSNAIEATERRKGAVTVRTEYDVERQAVRISVTDNGPGVPTEERERIFEAFHSTKGHRGTGLGLAVARKIVNELGGSIRLESPKEGGAKFIVELLVHPSHVTSSTDTLGPPR